METFLLLIFLIGVLVMGVVLRQWLAVGLLAGMIAFVLASLRS